MNYTIRECCGLCSHSSFTGLRETDDWGVCAKITDKGALRKLSVNRYGHCEEYKSSKYLTFRLESFFELLEQHD